MTSRTNIFRLRARRGFTIVEMLVTVAIIVVLLTILLVAVQMATRTAQRANTTFLLGSISQGLVRFKADMGYMPPILGTRSGPQGTFVPGEERDGVGPPDPNDPQYEDQLQLWYSDTSLAEYLLGYAHRGEDGYGFVGDPANNQFPNAPGSKEIPLLGFRNPGDDGVWGAWSTPRANFPANGSLASRNLPDASGGQTANNDLIPGKVYGPYLDLKESQLVGKLLGNGDVALPGEAAFDDIGPRVLVDYWGKPISYYRRLHLQRSPKSLDLRGNLGDVVALRPWSLKPGSEADGLADANNDTTTSKPLQTAEFGLLSLGADRRVKRDERVDLDSSFNKDNLVEVGR